MLRRLYDDNDDDDSNVPCIHLLHSHTAEHSKINLWSLHRNVHPNMHFSASDFVHLPKEFLTGDWGSGKLISNTCKHGHNQNWATGMWVHNHLRKTCAWKGCIIFVKVTCCQLCWCVKTWCIKDMLPALLICQNVMYKDHVASCSDVSKHGVQRTCE
jgi:hypothetical protein